MVSKPVANSSTSVKFITSQQKMAIQMKPLALLWMMHVTLASEACLLEIVTTQEKWKDV